VYQPIRQGKAYSHFTGFPLYPAAMKRLSPLEDGRAAIPHGKLHQPKDTFHGD
jgi:hypothetical protein